MPACSSTGGQRRSRPPGQRLQPRDEFGERERFGQIVVGAEAEAFDAIADPGCGGQQQHPRAEPRRGDPPAHLVAGAARHVPVEDGDVVAVDAELLPGGDAVVDHVDGHGQPPQSLGHHVGQHPLVVRDQHPQRRALLAFRDRCHP